MNHFPRSASLTYRVQGFWSDIGWQGPDFGMKSHPGDITSPIAATLSRAWGYRAQHAHMRLSPARTTRMLEPFQDMWRGHTSFCCSYTWPIWNQMSACAKGLGGFRRMRSKQAKDSSYFPCCLYIMPKRKRISFALSKSKSCINQDSRHIKK